MLFPASGGEGHDEALSLQSGMTLQFLHVMMLLFVFKQHEGHWCELCTPRCEFQPFPFPPFKGAVVRLDLKTRFFSPQTVLQNKSF